MKLNIKYFGLIAEVTDRGEEAMELDATSVSDVLEALYNKYPELKTKDFQVAQKQEIVTHDTEIDGGEIALLPPFSGG